MEKKIELYVESPTGEIRTSAFKKGATLEDAVSVCEGLWESDINGCSYSVLVDGEIYCTYES